MPFKTSSYRSLFASSAGGFAVLSGKDWALLFCAAAASLALIYVTLHDIALAAGVLLAFLVAGTALLLLRRTSADSIALGMVEPDWSITREAAEHDGIGIAITDRSGRMVCANDLYASWFGGFVTPPGLPVEGRGGEQLAEAGRKAWRDGRAMVPSLLRGALRLEAEIIRSGASDDYLLWRFRPLAQQDMVSDMIRQVGGAVGNSYSQAGIMSCVIGGEGRIRAANPAFLVRAAGRADAEIIGREFASYLRVDEQGLLYFTQERERGTPVRLLQIPLYGQNQSQNHSQGQSQGEGPVLVLLIDDDGMAMDRGSSTDSARKLVSLLPFGVAMVDRDGRFLHMNNSFVRAAGVGEGQAPVYPGDLVIAEDKSAVADAVRRYGSGQQLGGDIAVRLRSSPEEPVALSIAGVRGMGEASVLLSLKDNSEESRLKRQVAQASKMQAVGQLAGGVAHDFNNILTAIIGYCDLMLMRHTPGDSDYADIVQIQLNSNRAAALTRQLLAFSRQQTLRPQILQLPDVISEVSSLLNRSMGETVTMTVKHGRGLGPVRADPNQLEQVLLNLAVNARDAMPNGGELAIETYPLPANAVPKLGLEILPHADYSVLKVTDTGSGIPPEVLPKIFEPFFTTKDVGKGTGLGLSTVYGIVKQSGGFIFADAVTAAARTGKQKTGTSFTLYFPVHSGPDIAAAPPPKSVKARESWGSGSLLLVEDEDMVRAVAERALTRAGYSVTSASNGEDALTQLAGMDKIDLMISDVVMPQMDGPTLVRKVRGERPHLPVLFMSGYAEEQLRKSIALDNVAFLPKPFSVSQLIEKVQTVLSENIADG